MPTRILLAALALFLTSCSRPETQQLIVYSGRSQALVDPLIRQFTATSGVRVDVRYGGTAELAASLAEEGPRTSADLFWAQDAGALGSVHEAGLLRPLPDSLLNAVAAAFRNRSGTWVATSARARTLAYAPQRVDTAALPLSVFDLADARYAGRVGWAPTNGSFQAFVTGMRLLEGDDRTRKWLDEMKQNDARSYSNNTSIIQAIADGEIDLGLPNHYYLHRFKSEDPSFPVEQTFFRAGDPGDLVNVAGVAVLSASEKPELAERFIAFLLSDDAQEYFARETFEYPVVSTASAPPGLTSPARLATLQPDVDLDDLRALEGTLEMLRDAGLL